MEGRFIKEMRIRLGLTQGQLAELMLVDQGTVSRWERGAEVPRPASQSRLRDILLRDDARRALQRSLAVVRHNLLPSSLLDRKLRLIEISASGQRHFRQRGRDPDSLIGMDLERFADRIGFPLLNRELRHSGFLSGDALLFRFVSNFDGRGHSTVYEPIFEGGALVGVLNYVSAYFDLPRNGGFSVETIEAIQSDDPLKSVVLYSGAHAAEAQSALRQAG